MISLGKIFKKYTGTLRQLKASYVINNLLNRDRLQHNRSLYKKFGVRKSIYQSIGRHDFQVANNEIPWLDQPKALERLKAHPDYASFSSEIQQELVRFVEEGYMILKGFFPPEEVEKLNQDIDQLLQSRTLDFNYTGRKIMESFRRSEVVDQDFFRNERLLRLLNFVMGKHVIPFHTINFIEGSEQRAHSDFIHMSTEPLGYLIAAWTALEEIHEGNGPLFYYPKSHRLPYLSCQDYPSGNTKWTIGADSNKNFEDKVEALITEHQLEKVEFRGQAGDVFIWHANLLHGGSPIRQEGATRKSMVAHYFCEDVICYHEISQRPAFIDKH